MPVPLPLIMMSTSPQLAKWQGDLLKYYMGQETLSFPLLTSIRYLTAKEHGHPFCTNFNAGMLQAMGLTPEALAEVEKDPTNAPLEDNEKALLAFVIKAIDNPSEVSDADIEGLRSQGWSDQAIFDALFHGASMLAGSALYKALYKD